MSEQDTSEDLQVTSEQPTNTGRNSSEPATSDNKRDGKTRLLATFGVITLVFWVIYFCTGAERNSPEIHWLPISLMMTIIFVIILFLWKKLWVFKNISQFNSWIFGVTLIGGTIAFLLPLGIANEFTKDGEGTALRQMLIYTTGGLLGVITLSETRRKNDQEKKKNKDEKKKNKQDHIRQVHAERRSRYAKAIEQLADEKAAIRLGGVYTLVGLTDEWLADKSIKDEDDRRKEGQVIINNLCAYIRSPFSLAEKREIIEAATTSPYVYSGNLNEDKAKLREEQEVRQTIFNEISNHLAESTKKSPTDNYWKYFNYDFSKSKIFYSLNGLTFSNPNFSNTEFTGPANFTGSRFIGKAIFKNTIFNSLAYFSDIDTAKTTFEAEVDFTGSTFIGDAIFRNTTFTLDATFSSETSGMTNFESESDFSLSTFSHDANFSKGNFHERANFELSSFNGITKFRNTHFYGPAQFSVYGGLHISQEYSFSGDADFTNAYFKEGASFTERYFEKSAIFRNAIFEGPAHFAEGRITDRGIFTTTIFKDSSRFILYNFGTSTDFEEAKFSTDRAHEFDRTQNITLGSVPIGIGWPQHQIPLGSRYGLLSSWDSKTKSFTVTSDPAK